MRIRTPIAVAIDLVLVLVFSVVGRASHVEKLDLAGVAQTAWPFLIGCGVGWVIAATMLRRLPILSQGGVVWADTLIIGMLLRVLTAQGTALPFVIVAAIALGVLLLGWRLIYWLVRGRHEPRYRRRQHA